ncbi:hypothetical protein pb186bvf_000357 [Paramecium bursaria]
MILSEYIISVKCIIYFQYIFNIYNNKCKLRSTIRNLCLNWYLFKFSFLFNILLQPYQAMKTTIIRKGKIFSHLLFTIQSLIIGDVQFISIVREPVNFSAQLGAISVSKLTYSKMLPDYTTPTHSADPFLIASQIKLKPRICFYQQGLQQQQTQFGDSQQRKYPSFKSKYLIRM